MSSLELCPGATAVLRKTLQVRSIFRRKGPQIICYLTNCYVYCIGIYERVAVGKSWIESLMTGTVCKP